MRLESAEIRNFRSIENVSLTDFGGFNVFIGKNNAGKSNLLSTMHAFFGCLQGGDVVTLDPPIGREIDFFDKPPHEPIEIRLVFSLALAERDALTRDIVIDAPQVKNAVDGLDPTLRLRITPRPRSQTYVAPYVR
jgi:putative ATP-dependent endonuclease of OLD family